MADDGADDRYQVLQRLSEPENAVLGMAAGAIEAVATQPLTYTKNARQQGMPFTLNPKLLYRGVTISAFNDGSLTGLQFLLAGFFQKLITGGTERSLTFAEELGSSMASGAISGVPCAIMELTMIQQQRFGGSLWGTPARIMQAQGPSGLLRGLLPAINRECFFTAGYLGVSPYLHTMLMSDEYKWNPFVANITAASVGGVLAGALTHPFDTIKSCMQGDIERKHYGTFSQTARVLYEKGGPGQFFQGFTARASMIVLAFLIFNETKLRLAPIMCPHHFPSDADKWEKIEK